jgi:hypothetical protein
MQYSGALEGKPLPLVLQIAVGAADRGACIRDLSQYPAEVEYLFVPCSFLAPDGPPQFRISDGGLGVRVVPVRISTSHSARTIENLREDKKRFHMSAFLFIVGETKNVLTDIAKKDDAAAKRLARDVTRGDAGSNAVEQLLETITGQCEERLRMHKAIGLRAYVDNHKSQRLVEEMLDTQRWAVSKLRLWLEDPTECITVVQDYPLRVAHRMLTKFLSRSASNLEAGTAEERQAAALNVCKARGKVLLQIDEKNDLDEDPLVAAAADGAAASDIRMLIEARAALNLTDGASPALLEAATYGHSDVVTVLLKAKASLKPTQVLIAG